MSLTGVLVFADSSRITKEMQVLPWHGPMDTRVLNLICFKVSAPFSIAAAISSAVTSSQRQINAFALFFVGHFIANELLLDLHANAAHHVGVCFRYH